MRNFNFWMTRESKIIFNAKLEKPTNGVYNNKNENFQEKTGHDLIIKILKRKQKIFDSQQFLRYLTIK